VGKGARGNDKLFEKLGANEETQKSERKRKDPKKESAMGDYQGSLK